MAWVDANGDGVINASDPVYSQLKVWQDANGNGIVDPGERNSLSFLGIDSINYIKGTYHTVDGVTRQMSSVDLTADTSGTRTQVVQGGILVQTTGGQPSLIVTQIVDESELQANADSITNGIENVELIVSGADLTANDTFGGAPATGLTVSALDNFNHGSGYVDANGFVHFIPETNYSGNDAGFDYTATSPGGQSSVGHVSIDIAPVNQAPVVDNVIHDQRAIYGWGTTSESSCYGNPFPGHSPYTGSDTALNGNPFSGSAINSGYYRGTTYNLSVPIYQPYYSGGPVYGTTNVLGLSIPYLIRNDPVVYHDTVIGYDDPDTGQVVASDADDPASSLTYQIVGQPQMGGVTIDATGHYKYTSWSSPNTPMSPEHAQNDPTQTDAFEVRVTDPQGASVLQTVNVTHYGIYTPPAPPAGSDGGCPLAVDMDHNGFHFTPVDQSNVFFDINGDGWKHQVSWPTPGDGWLAYDANGDGKIDHADEIAFAAYSKNAKTDLEGLAQAFDSNGDGVFSPADDKWKSFGIWQDSNQNGITDPGEFKTLDELGVASIDLTSDGVFSVVDGNTIHGITKMHMKDGSTLDVADVTLSYSDQIQVPQVDGSTLLATHPQYGAASTIYGTPGADLILAQNGPMQVYADDGNDFVQGGAGDDYIEAGGGDDVVYAGDGNDIINAGAGNDVVFAGNGNDLVLGGDGNDALFGEAGNDIIYGGNGNDVISGGDGNDVLSGDAGDDIISGDAGNDALFGGAGNDQLYGGSGNDLLYGGDGNDLLDGGTGADTMVGGAGDDIYVVDNVGDVVIEKPNEGIDTVRSSIDYTLGANVENLTLTGTDNLNGTGNELDNVLIGNSGNNVLIGGAGNDTLDGGAGADTLIGGTGDDTYIVDNVGDVVIENANEGIDTVLSSINYTLGANVENLTLTGTDNLNGTGNELNNVLTGNVGNNVLDGGAGADTMISGAGDDTYIVDNVNDVVVENANEGIDTVLSSVSYTLSANVENLTLTGTANINGTGNELNNVLIGNAGNNVLDGGAGADTMIGGAGDDTYIVDNVGDVVVENANEGTDTVLSSINYTLGANVENLTLTGTDNLNGTGNELNNVLIGNAGNNVLDGGAGADTMIGGAGDDTYIVDNVNDVVVENANEGVDTVLSSVTYTLSANVENLTLTGTADINGTGNELNNVLIGNSGNNVLDGGVGADTLIGGAGNDTYIVDNVNDVVVENANEGIDTVLSSVSYTLAANVENLTLTGTSDINGTGNELDNVIIGNSGNNTLVSGAGNDTLVGNGGNDVFDGGTGNDTLIGGTGNDTYIWRNGDGLDTISDAGGNDTVQFGAALDLNNLALRVTTTNGVSTAHLRMLDDCGCEVTNQGLDFNVSMDANGNYISPIEQFRLADGTILHFDDLLIKTVVTKLSPQTRTLVTGRNDDIIYAGSTSDTVYSGTGNDIVYASSAGDTVYGQGGDDALIGGTGADTLNGGCGNNVLAGGNGQDALTVDDDNNLLLGGQGNDQIVVGGGNNFIAGGQQNDTITTGAGDNIIAFNRQDGQDVVLAAAGAHNTLSLGGGLRYSDLSLSRSGNDLLLDASHGDSITIKNWYASSANHSFVTLQMLEAASPDYAPTSTDVLRNNKIEEFDFQKLVSSFDLTRAANPTLAKWSVMNGLLDAHLAGSDTAAIGGEFAYEYGKTGSLAQVGIVAAETALKDPGFGGIQTLKPFQMASGAATIGQ